MAQSKQSENRDTLGSIFDFIFAETQKPPDKRKPVRPSNVDGSSEMVDAMTSVLEKPGLYVSDQLMQNLDEGLNTQITEAYFGTASPQGKTKILTKDLAKIFSDPNGFFDKAYQKSNPKLNLAQWAGKSYRGVLAASWAKKQGIGDNKTRWALNRAAASFDNPGDRLDMVVDARNLARKSESFRAIQKMMKSYSGDAVANVIKAIDGVNIQNANDLERALRTNAGISDGSLIRLITNEYNEKSIEGIDKSLMKGFKGKPFSYASQNTSQYRNIFSGYLGQKRQALEKSSDDKDKQQAQAFGKASFLVKNWNIDDRYIQRLSRERNVNLNKVRKELAVLNRKRSKTSADRARIIELKEARKLLSSDVRLLQSNMVQDNYAKYKGMWSSLNDIYLKGNLVGSILDGTFFSDSNTILNPVNQDYKGSLWFEALGEDEPIIFDLPAGDGFFSLITDPSSGKTSFMRRGNNFYNETMTHLSYLTPKKLFAINGQYAAFRMYKNRMKGFEKLMDLADDQESLAKKLIGLNLFDGDGNLDFTSNDDVEKFKKALTELEKYMKTDKALSKHMAFLKKFLKQDERLLGIAKTLSFWSRTKGAISDKITKWLIGDRRNNIADVLLKRFGSEGLLGTAITQWKNGAGIQVLIRGFVENILKKVGFSSGLFFTSVSTLLSGGLSFIAFKLFILLGKVLVVCLIGVIVLLFGSGMYSNSQMINYGKAGYLTPGETIPCEGFIPEELASITESDLHFDVPVPSNSTCPLGDGSFWCNQGYTGGRGSFSHSAITRYKPVDINTDTDTVFYAPQYCDEGGCKITSIRPATDYCSIAGVPYNGKDIRFDDGHGNSFRLVHVEPFFSVGEEIKGGEGVAVIAGDGTYTPSGCWSGGHLHLEITHNGAPVDPLDFLQEMGCNVPDESQCKG